MHDAADAKEASGVLWIYYGAAAGQGSNLVSTIAALQPNWPRRLYFARSQILWFVRPVRASFASSGVGCTPAYFGRERLGMTCAAMFRRLS
jgi:hypothetical protein